jgi:glyoxylase-like metal-dependent hydrolase (beta-lactamase superfamily II)
MHTWRVGDVEIVRVESTDLALPASAPLADWMVPAFGTDAGEVRIAFSALAIRTPTMRIVVDPWLADDNPRGRPDASDAADHALADLAAAGFAATEVDLVVNSHLDGIGWNTRPDGAGGWQPSFPNARYSYPAAQLATVDAGIEVHGADGLRQLRALTDVAGVIAPHQLTPEVRIVDAPGHDPGHAAVRIEDGGHLAVYAGHLVLSPFQVDDPGTTLAGEAEGLLAEATVSRRLLLEELADRNGLLLTTLIGGPGGGRVERQPGDGFRLVA